MCEHQDEIQSPSFPLNISCNKVNLNIKAFLLPIYYMKETRIQQNIFFNSILPIVEIQSQNISQLDVQCQKF